jgi:hypothetical protein
MTLEDFKNKLKKYTPPFVRMGIITEALYTALAGVFLSLYNAIKGLKDADWTGKGLLLNAEENRMIFSKTESEETIQERLSERYLIHSERGTEAGIRRDIADLLQGSVSITFYKGGEAGFILNKNYPGISPEAVLNASKAIVISS